ncbi:MAG: hypothetical protein ACRCUI_04415 [Polymorphobacter sp.]
MAPNLGAARCRWHLPAIDWRAALLFNMAMVTPAPPAALRGLVARLMHDDHARAHAAWVEGHLRLLTNLRAVFGNDMDKIIVLGAIGQQMMTDRRADDRSVAVSRDRLTNIGSIATATGVPRESVRRKVGELIAAGWIVRDTTGGLAVTKQAATELQPSSDDAVDMLDTLFDRFLVMMTARGWIAVQKRPDA